MAVKIERERERERERMIMSTYLLMQYHSLISLTHCGYSVRTLNINFLN